MSFTELFKLYTDWNTDAALLLVRQLDDVVSSLTTGERVEEAMWRSIRCKLNSLARLSSRAFETVTSSPFAGLDRCIAEHEKAGRTDRQNLFAIVQGSY